MASKAQRERLRRLKMDVACAVRAALCPTVTPLQPGETVTIPDGMCDLDVLRIDNGVYREYGRPKYLFLTPEIDGDTDDANRGQIALDAAGVAALIEVCQRFLATQEDDDDQGA